MTIKVKPISQRAKNRVREHGDTFRVRATGTMGTEAQFRDVLCVSPDGWFGWFERGVDIALVEVSE